MDDPDKLDFEPDRDTLRAVARLVRSRAERSVAVSQGDAMSRLGAKRALEQLAADLEATARQGKRAGGD